MSIKNTKPFRIQLILSYDQLQIIYARFVYLRSVHQHIVTISLFWYIVCVCKYFIDNGEKFGISFECVNILLMMVKNVANVRIYTIHQSTPLALAVIP